MSPYQQQYYSFLENKRRQAIQNNCLALACIRAVRNAITNGIIPWEDPEVNKYWILLSEDDKQIFISEIQSLNLTIEDDTTNPAK